jgi:hypothetical protein
VDRVSIYVKNDNRFEQAEALSRECPHCGAHAQLIPTATPSYAALMDARPRHAGVAFRCAACQEPRFARVAIRSFGPEQVVLSTNLVEIERAKEHFQFGYLPNNVGRLLRESFDCYTADLFTAFAVMARRAVQVAIEDARENGGPRLLDLFHEVVQVAEIDPDMTQTLQTVLFDTSHKDPNVDADQAAVMIELIKDIFYQCYVRTQKLKAAVRMRRYFAGETTQKVTPIASLTRKANSA